MSDAEEEQEEIEVTDDLIGRVNTWLSKHATEVPEEVRLLFSALIQSHETFKELLKKNKALRRLLAVHMGQIPKSERSHKDETKPKEGGVKPNKGKGSKKTGGGKRKKRKKNDSPSEAMYTPGPNSGLAPEIKEEKVDPLQKFPGVDSKRLVSSFKEREVIDIKFSMILRTVRIETLVDPATGQTETAEYFDAPEGSRYTFGTMLWMVYLHVQCFLPMHRLERMFSIARSSINHMLRFFAAAFAPIYIELGKDVVKNSRYIFLDDTKERTLEKSRDEVPTESEDPEGTALKVGVDILNYVCRGFGLPKLGTTATGKKKKPNHTVFIGESEEGDTVSSIVFHMTHQGQAGDLLTQLLKYRNKSSPPNLDLICDLLPANLPTIEMQRRHKVRVCGCSAHARRPFWKHRDLDDQMWWFIRAFKALANLESWMKSEEFAKDKILALRGRYANAIWQLTFKEAEKVLTQWPKESAPTKAANYILNHKAELTRYIRDARLPATNSLSERALRREKIMLANSKFRATLEGRVVLDIITTIIGTCIRARIPWDKYALDVLKNRKAVALNPAAWTPKAWHLAQLAKTTASV